MKRNRYRTQSDRRVDALDNQASSFVSDVRDMTPLLIDEKFDIKDIKHAASAFTQMKELAAVAINFNAINTRQEISEQQEVIDYVFSKIKNQDLSQVVDKMCLPIYQYLILVTRDHSLSVAEKTYLLRGFVKRLAEVNDELAQDVNSEAELRRQDLQIAINEIYEYLQSEPRD